MNDEKTVLEAVSDIDEFMAISQTINDKDLDDALSIIIKLIMKPDIPPQAATQLIIKLQAISTKFAIMSTYYKSVAPGKPGTDEYKKKNIYITLHESINELVSALKYNIRGFNV